MYISIGTIITAGSLIGALGVIGGVLIAAYKFFKKPEELEENSKRSGKPMKKIFGRLMRNSAWSLTGFSPA